MKYFLDTEFIENGTTIDLISIGIVCEDGRTLYKQNKDCKFTLASDWVWRNVFPHLLHFHLKGDCSCNERRFREKLDARCGDDNCVWAYKWNIRDAILEFCDVAKHGKPEFWGYYADYDWVAFCQLFGTMMDLPKGFPMYCRDIKQWADQLGNPTLPKPEVEIHHALADAQNVEEMWKFLDSRTSALIS
jgi:hypothetical protein